MEFIRTNAPRVDYDYNNVVNISETKRVFEELKKN